MSDSRLGQTRSAECLPSSQASTVLATMGSRSHQSAPGAGSTGEQALFRLPPRPIALMMLARCRCCEADKLVRGEQRCRSCAAAVGGGTGMQWGASTLRRAPMVLGARPTGPAAPRGPPWLRAGLGCTTRCGGGRPSPSRCRLSTHLMSELLRCRQPQSRHRLRCWRCAGAGRLTPYPGR